MAAAAQGLDGVATKRDGVYFAYSEDKSKSQKLAKKMFSYKL
jgi:hypothetical protein